MLSYLMSDSLHCAQCNAYCAKTLSLSAGAGRFDIADIPRGDGYSNEDDDIFLI